MEAFTDDTVGETLLMWGAQLGKTELLLNAIGYHVDANPSPMLVVYPTLDTARKWSTKKLAVMLRETPRLDGKVDDPRGRESGNTILSKDFPGGSIVIAGSNSPASLRQISVRVVIQDEVDTYDASAGHEGDPCLLADARASNFHDAILIKASTPTIKGSSRIEAAYEESDQREWHCPCTRCGEFQTLKWGQVRWPEEDTSGAVYVCESCGENLTDTDRIKMILDGEWRAQYPNRRVRGYRLSGLYRIMGKKRQFQTYLHEFVENFLTAKHSSKEMLKVWVNTFLCETWEEEGDAIDARPLMKRAEDYGGEDVPEGVGLLTAGIDVQHNRLEVEVCGWGHGEECWGIEVAQIFGNTERSGVWDKLDEFLDRKWRHPSGATLKVICAAVDSGDRTKTVYSYVKRRQQKRIFAVKGSNVRGAAPIAKRSMKSAGVVLYSIGTDTLKDAIFERLKLESDGPRYKHFPVGYGYDEEYYDQLTAEEKRTKFVNGFPVNYYKKVRARNEALDLRVYNMAALEILNPQMGKVMSSLLPEEKIQKATKIKKNSGFVNSWRH
tara:strand:+ start:2956 stop:4614 length:1659 start_codon:yes stop_codon:yes gene_type:complete